ncbi:alpha-1-antitrypsin-related protein-like [Phodopus roborovskii]|uniref:alpha-1-antitrypsin-related protein-like n=1 Tax=Phodopus roborovskii TaxID=109678 RepID=UPI0021E359E4|nr:alpha-1-antitrypsin-related protein-like [Phodopus roborovskii]
MATAMVGDPWTTRTMPRSFSHSFLLLAGLCCLLPGSQTRDYQKTGASDSDKNPEHTQCQNFASTITNISLSLLQKASNWPKQTNFVFSPMSIVTAFAMLSLGAKGSTHKEILNGLKFDLMMMPEMEVHKCFQHLVHTFLQPNYQVHMTLGSSLFINKGLKVENKFKKMAMELYNSEVISINFRDSQTAKMQINKHVMKRSYGHVLKIIKDLPIDTVLALVTHISFNGVQIGEFEPEHVDTMEFQLDSGKVVIVPIVKRQGTFYLLKDKNLSSWVLMQHYAGNIIAFFILPELGKMEELIQNLSHKHLNSIHRRISTRISNLHFPKLTVSTTYDLKTVMNTLGITQIFSSKADLSKVTKKVPVKLSKAVHKAMLGIEDKPSEASEFPDLYKALLPDGPTIEFNRSFLVIIKDKTFNLPFLVGKIEDPKAQ